MSDSTDLTVEQAREIILTISRSKGWVRPELREPQNPQHQELLETLRSIREELGDVVETYALLHRTPIMLLLIFLELQRTSIPGRVASSWN